jgi:hypothetical protein
MPGSSQATAIRPRQAPRDVQLRTWPLVDGEPLAWGCLLAAAVVFWTAAYASSSAATGAVLAGLVLVSVWRLWIPIHTELSAAGVTQSVLGRSRRIPWTAIGAIERRTHGLLILRDRGPVPLTELRGLYLPYRDQKADMLALVDFYLAGRVEAQ